MILKNYQKSTLDILQKFFETCRIAGAEAAYRYTTSDPEIAARLGNLRGNYVSWNAIPNTPRVCLKLPTGGGKTIIAARAIKIAADTWCGRENPIVLWFCPSDTIRRQTSEALKNPRHSYRIALEEQFRERVRIFDLDEKFNIRPADIESGACIIVSTIQAFRQSNTDKYNVYKDNENLEPHFEKMTARDGMEKKEDGSRVKYSFANLLYYHRPIVIVDEAHNVISGLSQETQGRLNPSAIVELTATPQWNNNTLYNVRAAELKEEEMIKLPIELREHIGWEPAVDESIAKLAELEKAAEGEREYLRPILLFQAQDKNGQVNVDVLKNYLLETANIPENQIAVATGEQKELDGVDVFARGCPVKYIITIEALKEGWDCPFAYILCSLANVQSNTAVEQILGRVMRMPYAKARQSAALNKAYAYVLSQRFGEATGAIVSKLAAKGFDDAEAAAAVEQKLSELPRLFGRREIDKVDLERPITAAELPASIKTENDGRTIIFTPETSEDDIKRLIPLVSPEKASEIHYKYGNYRLADREAPPAARQGASFSAPKLMVELQGKLVLAEPAVFFMRFDWDIAKLAGAKLDEHEFGIESQGNGFVINLDGNKLKYTPSGEEPYLPQIEVDNWTAANLVDWLDRKLRQVDIPQPKMLEWLRQIIEYLAETRKLSLSALMIAKHALANKIESKIKAVRSRAREQAYQEALFERDSRVVLDFDNGFNFFDSMYEGVLPYQGRYKFQKHYLGSQKVPMIDGGETGEEFACAKALDSLPQVKYWLRNAARHKNSFWLPTSEDKFYPDFIAELEDGRILVVEYKGAHLADSRDTKEKRMIGELWEKHSNGRGIFLIAEKSKDGLNTAEQIRKKVSV